MDKFTAEERTKILMEWENLPKGDRGDYAKKHGFDRSLIGYWRRHGHGIPVNKGGKKVSDERRALIITAFLATKSPEERTALCKREGISPSLINWWRKQGHVPAGAEPKDWANKTRIGAPRTPHRTVPLVSGRGDGTRRQYSDATKVQIVREYTAAASLEEKIAVSERHRVGRTQIYGWRKRYLAGDYGDPAATAGPAQIEPPALALAPRLRGLSIEEKMRRVAAVHAHGGKVRDACDALKFDFASYYRWKKDVQAHQNAGSQPPPQPAPRNRDLVAVANVALHRATNGHATQASSAGGIIREFVRRLSAMGADLKTVTTEGNQISVTYTLTEVFEL